MNQKITIEKADNGFILSWQEEREQQYFKNLNDLGENNPVEEKEVIENTKYDDEKEAMEKLLHFVANFFGVSYDKYKEDNLKITWDLKGHKL